MPKTLTPAEAEQFKKALKEAFDKFDSDKSGSIDSKEFENVLCKFNASSECKTKTDAAKIKETAKKFIETADKDADGKVNFYEFYRFVLQAFDIQA